jgi:hypothetical protein
MLTTTIKTMSDAQDAASEAAGRLRVALALVERADDFRDTFKTDGWERAVLRDVLEDALSGLKAIASANLKEGA